MGATYNVAINSVSIPCGKHGGRDHAWGLYSGFAAPIQLWKVPNEIALDLVAKYAGQEVILDLDHTHIKRVILLGNEPADDPWNQMLALTDVRWYWTRKWMVFDANARRAVGDQVLLGNTLTNATYAPTIRYLPYSLFQGQPYTFSTFMEAALRRGLIVGNAPLIYWTVDDGGLVPDKIIEERLGDQPLPIGIARAVTAIPGRNLYVDVDGLIHVFDAVPGHEKAPVDEARKLRLAGHGDMTWVDQRGKRPKDGWKVYSTPKLEVRIDYDPTRTFGENDFYLEPVIKCPDQILTIPALNGRPARKVGFGSWITRAEAYAAWGSGTVSPQAVQLTDDIVRANFLNDGLVQYWVLGTLAKPDLTWSRRISALHTNWRSTFRINPKAWTRVLAAEPLMSAIWDQATGTRAPSPTYVNMARYYQERWYAANVTAASVNDFTSFPASGKLIDGFPNAVKIIVEDEEQGIFSFVPDMQQLGLCVGSIQNAYMYTLERVANIDPSSDPNGLLQVGTLNGLFKGVAESKCQLSTILSLVPSAPNDTRRLYSTMVTMDEVAASIGLPSPVSVGPPQELRTWQSPARFAWQDDQNISSQILAYFGIGIDPTMQDSTIPKLKPINYDSEIRPLALANAAADLYNLLDHYEGVFSIPMAKSFVPIGSISKVIHRVGKNYSQTMLIGTPTGGAQVNALDLLPASVRSVVLKMVAQQ